MSAVDVLGSVGSARAHFLHAFESGQTRKKPLIHISKQGDASGLPTIKCRAAERVFARKGLYHVPHLKDDLARGAARHIATQTIQGLPTSVPSETELRALARRSFDRNVVESKVMQPFEQLALREFRRVYKGKILRHRYMRTIANYIGFSLIRTAGWADHYMRPLCLETNRVERKRRKELNMPIEFADDPTIQAYDVALRECGFLLHLANFHRNRDDPGFNPLVRRRYTALDILVAPDSGPGFILTDQPGRPIAVLGSDNDSHALLPLSPRLSLRLSKRPPIPVCARITVSSEYIRFMNTQMFEFAFESAILPSLRDDIFVSGFDWRTSKPFTEDPTPFINGNDQ